MCVDRATNTQTRLTQNSASTPRRKISRQHWTSLCSASFLGCQNDTARIRCWAPCCGVVTAGICGPGRGDRAIYHGLHAPAPAAVDRYQSRGGSRGWLGWLVTPLVRQPISCYCYACNLSYLDVVLCPSLSQILATPLHQEVRSVIIPTWL